MSGTPVAGSGHGTASDGPWRRPTLDQGGPLAGVRVVDLSRALAGPYATMMLADAGADVIKAEPPAGDDSRGWLPFAEVDGHRESAYFLSANRGKRSVRLDLKARDGADRLRWLLSSADVLVENYRPGVLDRLGFGPDALGELNPRLVVLSLTGFGSTGPDGNRPGFDQIVQAEGGLMSLNGDPDREPLRFGLPIADILAGMFGAYGVLAALRERDRSGLGQRVDTSLLAAVVGVHVFHGAGHLLTGHEPRRTGNRHPSIAPYGVFQCSDASIVIAVGSESLWRKLAAALGLDPDATGMGSNAERVARVVEVERAVNAALENRTADEAIAVLEEAGVPAGRIRTVGEVYASAQVQHLGLIERTNHPTLGEVSLPGTPLRWSRWQRPAALHPPLLGEHEDEIFAAYRDAGGTTAREDMRK
jgi:crotonobetainyl-CoA:carnitine CoA-transferase CaiB-like acyl-CoA transferase